MPLRARVCAVCVVRLCVSGGGWMDMHVHAQAHVSCGMGSWLHVLSSHVNARGIGVRPPDVAMCAFSQSNLERQMNRARQAKITQEIMEIISGANSV